MHHPTLDPTLALTLTGERQVADVRPATHHWSAHEDVVASGGLAYPHHLVTAQREIAW